MQGFTFSSLFLAMDSTTTIIIAAVIAVVLGVAGCIVGWYIGAKRTKNNFEKEKGTLTKERLDDIKATILPYLNENQIEFLDKLIEKLNV